MPATLYAKESRGGDAQRRRARRTAVLWELFWVGVLRFVEASVTIGIWVPAGVFVPCLQNILGSIC